MMRLLGLIKRTCMQVTKYFRLFYILTDEVSTINMRIISLFFVLKLIIWVDSSFALNTGFLETPTISVTL